MATRIYLPSTGTAPVSPAFNTNWADTADATRFPCVFDTASSTAMATTQYRDNSNKNEAHLIHQWVSTNQIAGQVISAQTIKFQMRGLELNANNDMVFAISVRVCSPDGTTIRGNVLDVSSDDSELPTGTLTNRSFSATSSEVTAQAGDRIMIEIGCAGDPSGGNNHDVDIRIGDNAGADLAENDT